MQKTVVINVVPDIDGEPLALQGEALIVDMSEGCGPADWTQVEKHWTGELQPKVHGFIFRATEGTIYDDRGLEYVAGAQSIGCDAIGLYGWQNPKLEASKNIAQADALVRFVNRIGFLPKLGLWQDDETDFDHLTFQDMRSAIMKYNDRVESGLGMEAGTFGKYSRQSWWYENVANPINGWTDIPKGVHKPGYTPRGRPVWECHPDSPPPFRHIDDWVHRFGVGCEVLRQYSFKGRISGVDAAVDYSTFNGTLPEYVSYYGLTIPPEPTPDNGEHMAQILVDGLSLRNDGVFDPSTLYGKGIIGGKLVVTDELKNGYRKGFVWVWDKSIKLLD